MASPRREPRSWRRAAGGRWCLGRAARPRPGLRDSRTSRGAASASHRRTASSRDQPDEQRLPRIPSTGTDRHDLHLEPVALARRSPIANTWSRGTTSCSCCSHVVRSARPSMSTPGGGSASRRVSRDTPGCQGGTPRRTTLCIDVGRDGAEVPGRAGNAFSQGTSLTSSRSATRYATAHPRSALRRLALALQRAGTPGEVQMPS